MVAGFESVETGNSIVTPQSYVVKHKQYVLKQYTLHSSRTHIEPSTKHITSNKYILNLTFTVVIVTQFIVYNMAKIFKVSNTF